MTKNCYTIHVYNVIPTEQLTWDIQKHEITLTLKLYTVVNFEDQLYNLCKLFRNNK